MTGDRQFGGAHAVVLGGAGFLGSHLCDRLAEAGARVTCIDNFVTGSGDNVSHLVGRGGFRLVDYNITNYLHVPGAVDFVFNFASPASPIDYLQLPIQTLKVGALGTHNALGMALDKGATYVHASTSEVYGDPLVNPQPETYWGNVNPIGPRGVYDEAKRYAEALTLAYHRVHDVPVRIVRIFNSILADEQVVYDDGVQLRREPIGDLAERIGQASSDLSGYSVPAFDRDGSMRVAGAVALVGHSTSKRCFEVSTRYGRSIRVTEDHSLFTADPEGKPTATPTSDVKPGDRVAIARRISVPERDVVVVDLPQRWLETGRNSWDLDILHESFGEIAWRRRYEIFDIVAQQRPPVGASRFRAAVWSRVRAMSERHRLPLAVINELGMSIPSDARARIHGPGRASDLPVLVPVSNELLWTLGLMVAEGCIHRRQPKSAFMTISGAPGLLDRASKILERDLGLHVVRSGGSSDRAASMFVHSVLLLDLLEWLGFEADEKSIPGWILGLPLSRLAWFIEGYREGDGVHSGKRFEEARRHEFSTTSTRLKDDLVVAFARFGLLPSVGRYSTTFRQRTGDRRYPFWRLTLCNVSPWSPLDWAGGVTQRLNARTTGDLVWAKVTRIEEVAPTELVYDFCVPGYENFWAGTGIMAHNTYGPRMRVDDGRAVPAFFKAAIENRPLPVHGDGSQTRSLCYVDDLIEGILRLARSGHTGPMNIGNPHEVTIGELAEAVQDVVGRHPGIDYQPRPVDDPTVRCPDISLARDLLDWEPQVRLHEGLERTLPWFRQALGR